MLRRVRLFLSFQLFLCLLVFGMSQSLAFACEKPDWREQIRFSGLLESMQSLRLHAPHDKVTSRVHARLKLEADFEELYAFISMDAEKNWTIPKETDCALHEAWIEHSAENWDLRVGRQIIIWGKADGVQITDTLSPPDYTEALTRDLDEIRQPVDALKFRVLGELADLEIIWIPVFRPARAAKGKNPWALPPCKQTQQYSLYAQETKEPSSSLVNSEIACKLSAYLPGLDLAASVSHTWDDFPTVHPHLEKVDGKTRLFLRPEHHRLTIFGLEASTPWNDFVFRGEAALYMGRFFSRNAFREPLRKHALKWLLGVDWSPGSNWTVIAQCFGQSILEYETSLESPEHDASLSLNLSKKLWHQTLTLSSMLYYHVNDGDFFERIKADYELTDGVHFLAGADFFGGSNTGFGAYTDNSQCWIKFTYNF